MKAVHAIAASVLLAVSALGAQVETEYGPSTGTLVIVGGGSLIGSGIREKFIELAGGPDKKFIIVPTAAGNRKADGSAIVYVEAEELAPWRALGLKQVKMLHTHDPKIADSEEFAKDLKEANAVWFEGGRQWNLVDSYAQTRTLVEFRKVLERGGVIGGTSAGATILGDYLVRGDTSGPNIVMTEEQNHQSGFKFLRRSAIDQHVDTRGRWDDLIPVVQKFPTLLGIGLSENTALIVRGDVFEVIGRGKVALNDHTKTYAAGDKPYYLLAPGDVYNMKTRTLVR